MPLHVATGPAAVSTCCQRLKAVLNDVRMNDLQPETHERILILEVALTNLNGGQGMGFLLGMTVSDLSAPYGFATLRTYCRQLRSACMHDDF